VELATPVLLGPVGTIFTDTPTFSWTAVPGATQYFFELEDITTGAVAIIQANPDNSVPDFPVTPGDVYAWFVQAQDNLGDSSAVSKVAVFNAITAVVPPGSGGG
jgi:hypothetical protein